MRKIVEHLTATLLALTLAGCGHTFYFESDTIGLNATVPCGERTIGVTIGSSKIVQASVRGGSTFETTTTSGAGILSGAGGVAKLSRMSTNMQLNEGYLADIMLSTNVTENVKIELAKALTTAKAPTYESAILQTGNSMANTGNEAVKSNVVGHVDKTGVDLIVATTPEIVKPVVSGAVEVVDNTVNKVTGVVDNITTNNVVAQITHVPGDIATEVHGVVTDLAHALVVVIAIIVGIIFLLFLMWFIGAKMGRKKQERVSTAKDAKVIVEACEGSPQHLGVPEADNNEPTPAEEEVIPLIDPKEIHNQLNKDKPKGFKKVFKIVFAPISWILSIVMWFFGRRKKKNK